MVNSASDVDWTIVDVSENLLPATRVYGPVLLGPTRHWQEYVKDRYGEEVDTTNFLKDSRWDYLSQWAEFYSNEREFRKIQDKDAYDFLDRLYRTTHGEPLPFKRPLLTKARIQDVRLRNVFNMMKHLGDNFNCASDLIQAEEKRPLLQADIHVAKEGWIDGFLETEVWEGKQPQKKHIEALRCRFTDSQWRVSYRVCNKDGQWGLWAINGEMAGTTGQSAPLTGIAFRFDSGPSMRYSIRYRIRSTKNDSKWTAWTEDGVDLLPSLERLPG